MKRTVFTMIESIFVIAILGILVAVAVPKFATIRDDAKIARGVSDIATLVTDLFTFYTSQGTFAGKNSEDITNVKVMAHVPSLADDARLKYSADGEYPCIVAKFISVADGNISISIMKAININPNSAKDALCKAVQAKSVGVIKTFKFGGVVVVE